MSEKKTIYLSTQKDDEGSGILLDSLGRLFGPESFEVIKAPTRGALYSALKRGGSDERIVVCRVGFRENPETLAKNCLDAGATEIALIVDPEALMTDSQKIKIHLLDSTPTDDERTMERLDESNVTSISSDYFVKSDFLARVTGISRKSAVTHKDEECA